MAEASVFPQVPANVWWGVRNVIARNPRVTLDSTSLATLLNVQPTAARQYATQLQQLGIVDENYKVTDLAGRWRTDEAYTSARQEILEKVYPGALLELAEPTNENRAMIERWFTGQGLGVGTAKNKTATYLLVGGDLPSEIKSEKVKKTAQNGQSSKASSAKSIKKNATSEPPTRIPPSAESMPLNVNVQIHISADASSDQINSIFDAMRRYLKDA